MRIPAALEKDASRVRHIAVTEFFYRAIQHPRRIQQCAVRPFIHQGVRAFPRQSLRHRAGCKIAVRENQRRLRPKKSGERRFKLRINQVIAGGAA